MSRDVVIHAIKYFILGLGDEAYINLRGVRTRAWAGYLRSDIWQSDIITGDRIQIWSSAFGWSFFHLTTCTDEELLVILNSMEPELDLDAWQLQQELQ